MSKDRGSDPCFGDELTADVTLRLLSSPTACEALTLHLHSKVLIQRSEYFQAQLSERWSMGDTRPIELTLTHCQKNPVVYKRCIELMYTLDKGKHTSFTSVEDALDILGVAAELLFHDCLNPCMNFLAAVPWSRENEIAIRSCLASWHLEMTTDLATRLFVLPGCKPTEVMKDVLGDLLAVTLKASAATRKTSNDQKTLEITDRVLRNNVGSSVSSAFAGVNEAVLYGKWFLLLGFIKEVFREYLSESSKVPEQLETLQVRKAITRLASASCALKWVFNELLVLKIADAAVTTFAEDNDLPSMDVIMEIGDERITGAFVFILESILLAFERRELVLSTSVRIALVQHCFVPGSTFFTNNMAESFCALLESLPQVDQGEIFKRWIKEQLLDGRKCPDLSAAFEHYCDKLRQVQQWQETKELQQSSAKEKV